MTQEPDLFGAIESSAPVKANAPERRKETKANKASSKPAFQPLAERMRPRTIDEVIGQKKLLVL